SRCVLRAGWRCPRCPGAGEVVAVTELVRICPVCDAHNAPQNARCTCGASLLGIDFSLPQVAEDGGAAQIGATATGVDAASLPTPAPLADITAQHDVDPLAGLLGEPVATPLRAAPTPPRACPYPDCAQPNPADAVRCLYCNRPLASDAP